MRQAWMKSKAPSSVVWSLRTMPIRRLPTSLAQALLALAQRQSAEVLAVELQKVERVSFGVQKGL
jgi:hypothetical protein